MSTAMRQVSRNLEIPRQDVTVPRVAIFRDAIVDLFDMELGTRLVAGKCQFPVVKKVAKSIDWRDYM